HGVRKILTQCPHCMNSLTHDYPQFGDKFEVVHHTEFLQQQIDDGKLDAPERTGSVTYHDPCYLARVNSVHQAPRDLLGDGISEMGQRREKTFCCGAGGGRMWMEEEADQRVSVLRAKEAVETGADTVAVGCPFCLTMMTDGVKSCGSGAEVEDVAENLAKRLGL
ncbi:MAG: (Fe-S)-binding protein, partial [Verrucomicrobiota bacterium]|nr:(Fe-S)-binding protein [Verrucomicrobiota bacterium]